jgi:hypothetical protein
MDLKRFFGFAFLAGYLGTLSLHIHFCEAASHPGSRIQNVDYRRPDVALRKMFRLTQSGNTVNLYGVTGYAQKSHFGFIFKDIASE